eukprot:512878-Amphidinium_carterae.1
MDGAGNSTACDTGGGSGRGSGVGNRNLGKSSCPKEDPKWRIVWKSLPLLRQQSIQPDARESFWSISCHTRITPIFIPMQIVMHNLNVLKVLDNWKMSASSG